MLLLLLTLFIIFTSSRIYQVELTVDDGYSWTTTSNTSILYFVLTTNLDGDIMESPAFIIKDGLPLAETYKYSVLLDDIGDIQSLRLLHSDRNTLCLTSISVDDKTVSADYDCNDQLDCQQITAYFDSSTIVNSPSPNGCDQDTISDLGLLKQYNMEIKLSTTHNSTFYDQIGITLEGFVFNDMYLPYYNITSGQVHEYENGYSSIFFSFTSYDVTPIQSLVITNGNKEEICVESAIILVTHDMDYNAETIFDSPQCISYEETDNNDADGCIALNIDMRKDKATQTIYEKECPFASISWEYETEHRSDTAGYTFIVNVTDGTEDYIFYQMEGHNGDRTECFYMHSYQLPEGVSEHRYGHMKNIGNPKKLFLLHDRDDNFCIDYISVNNDRTNDTVIRKDKMCSEFQYDESDPGRCSVITIDFETNTVSNVLSETCPFNELCQFGIYEPPYSSKGLHPSHIVIIIFMVALIVVIIFSLICGYKSVYCNSVHGCLIHFWDPCVDSCWNPKCSDKLCRGKCHCANTTEMQHNMCCYCCGCDYCNPFSIHRRRQDKKKHNQIAMERRKRKKKKGGRETIDEYDTEDGDTFNLTTSHAPIGGDEMGSMDNVDLGDNIAGNGGHKHSKYGKRKGKGGGGGGMHQRVSRYSNPSHEMFGDDSDDELGNIGGYGDSDDDDSTELRTRGNGGSHNKNRMYSQLDDDVEDAPINATGIYDDNDDDDDDMGPSGVVDHYDDPELR